ncbi:phosphatases II [Aulographum hederae CBS 113979]|uniref:Phosphatases II n=1 Tax=Aulographum hederae CBS 113979 TaxID=1176131 RepID=A0A6G1GT70_9PEZI|nr:phosphatases II [Aulographum hederae CBS 113979]
MASHLHPSSSSSPTSQSSLSIDSRSSPVPLTSSVDTTPSRHQTRPSQSSTADTEPPLPPFLRLSKSDIHNCFIDLEWLQRHRLAQGQLSNDQAASQYARVSGDVVIQRNRYMNVDPFQSNRVKLKVPEGVDDYINASPIVLVCNSGRKRRWIATQGPKETSTPHIWRMIAAETTSPAITIMLTQTHESGREKCFPYYPPSLDSPTLLINEDDEFKDGFKATLTLDKIIEDPETRSTVREMRLQSRGGTIAGDEASQATKSAEQEELEDEEANSEDSGKKIHHFLFGGWPDFLIPEGADRAALLSLIRRSNELNDSSSTTSPSSPPDESNPPIIHCSAGVGRSGTFIALDFLLGELEAGVYDDWARAQGDKDPIAECVDRLRCQRMMMVQGEGQFLFLYEVLRERWEERWREGRVVVGERGEKRGSEEEKPAGTKEATKDRCVSS